MHVAHANYSFASTQEESERLKHMFPNCPMTQGYAQADAKVQYDLQFRITLYSKEQLKYMMLRDALLEGSSMRAPIDLTNSMVDMLNIG